jgi:hypothetical protein
MKCALWVLLLWLGCGEIVYAQEMRDDIPMPVPTASPEPERPSQADEWLHQLVEDDLPFMFHVLFSGGYQRVPLGPLNTRLQAQGYDAASEDFLSLGGSIQFSAWDVLTEFEGHVATTLPVVNQDYWMTLSASQVFFNLGYQFRPLKQLRIYPIAGIGVAALDLSFMRRALFPTFYEF